MQVERSHWAGRAAYPTAAVLKLPQDVLVEVACLLDVPTLLSLRQVCRILSALTREPVIFARLLVSSQIPPLHRPLPTSLAPSPEQRVVHACRLHKNWDLAALPVTVRTVVASRPSILRPPPLAKPAIVPAEPPLAAPLPYHLPPGAEAYPFLKLETYAPFRDTVAKSKPPVSLPSNNTPHFINPQHTNGSASTSTSTTRSSQPAPTPPSLRTVAGAGNFATATLRAWHASAPLDPGLTTADGSIPGSGMGPIFMPATSGASGSAPTPPPAPAPRPTRVASVAVRAVHARIVAGGKWGVFVVKRSSGSGGGVGTMDKGKQRADALPLTAEALAHLSHDATGMGKGKAKAVPVDEARIVQWAGASASTTTKNDGDPFLVIYDLDAVDGIPEKGYMAEYPIKWTPAGMACRATSAGIVITLASGTTEGGPYTTILRWSYESTGITHIGSYKSKCPLGSITIQEYEARTLVAIVHRPWTVMIQDIDSGQRCFVKLSKVMPRHTIQAVHLIAGPHLLVVRKVQVQVEEDPDNHAYVLEEYELPPMGESVYPGKPVQRQWIRGMDLHNITLCEGPTYEGGTQPDIALWAFSTLPHRAMAHWILRAGPKTGIGTTNADPDQPEPELPAIERDIFSDEPDTVYAFPAEHVSNNKLSFPHHKATLAAGAQRAMWFERPERSRTGEARGMRGVWAYTSVERRGLSGEDRREGNRRSREEKDGSVVRNCTRELPEDVLNAMENNTLGVAFDECSGRTVVLTCGDSYGPANGCRIWVLDYA